ncbi:Hsp70 family protein [Bradyrhizobium sp. STM 3557]|uniref:Hsp70 family protein n=1 Tax=Bradyrhizobium sp. STM 3557 TaxID=578920 RepID=UPI00388D4903
MVAAFCGIDFGTSNTTVGLSDHVKAQLLPLEQDHLTLPSAMFFDFEDHGVHYGRSAIDLYLKGHDGRFMRALKSILGTALIHEKTYIRQKAVPFSTILGFYFANLKRRIEAHLGREISEVVLGRPVRFVDKDDAADAEAQRSLEDIAREQGFARIAFQYEPIAAALDYEQQVNREELVLIVDIGGGTSDFSIVRVSPERRAKAERGDDILANGGIHIGGTDFDRLLSLKCVMPHLGFGSYTADRKRHLPTLYYHELATWHRINQLYKKNVLPELRQIRYEAEQRHLVDRFIRIVEDRQGHAIAIGVEQAKIALTAATKASSELAHQGDWAKFSFTRKQLDAAIADSVDRVVATVRRLLDDARIKAGGINTIFLTGGSSMVPALRRGILSLFPDARTAESDLLGSVGIGLALDARRKFG